MSDLDFKKIFAHFADKKKSLKTISVASCSRQCRPNSAPKMLVDIVEPAAVLFLDYRFTQTFANMKENPRVSISFMDDDSFTGYRLSGDCELIESGKEFENAKKRWEKRLTSYEADRIVKRLQGQYSAREAENTLPKDFVIVRMTASEGAIVKPDRVLRAINSRSDS